MKKENFFPFLIVIFFITAISFFLSSDENLRHIKQVKIAEQSIKVELALTQKEQMGGLSGRSEMKENEGMLFIFYKPGIYPFWMKNMNFAIDMIWIGEDLRVVYIKKDARPENFLETFGPEQDAKYVLEVVSGFSEKNNLKEGDEVQFVY